MVELLPPYFSRQCAGQREEWFLPPFLPLHLFLIPPHLSVFLFLPLQHVFCCPASRRAYRCHCQLFGPSVTLWSREKMSSKKKKNRLPSIFVNINSHERMIPDDLGDPELPELKQEMTRWAKLYLDILCPRENDLFLF